MILNHELVPLHEIMKKKDAEVMLNSYKIKKEMLPKILEEDPIVIAIGAKKGDILKITRNSETAGKAQYYRLVI